MSSIFPKLFDVNYLNSIAENRTFKVCVDVTKAHNISTKCHDHDKNKLNCSGTEKKKIQKSFPESFSHFQLFTFVFRLKGGEEKQKQKKKNLNKTLNIYYDITLLKDILQKCKITRLQL